MKRHTVFTNPTNSYNMKRTYMAPASERIELQSEQMIATSLGVNEEEAPVWNKKKEENMWDSSLWGTQE